MGSSSTSPTSSSNWSNSDNATLRINREPKEEDSKGLIKEEGVEDDKERFKEDEGREKKENEVGVELGFREERVCGVTKRN